MNSKHFLRACEFISSNLIKFDVNHVFNSIGSHIFLEFGKQKKIVWKNGSESTQSEWSIWIGNASWRVSKNGKYVAGSGDSPELMESSIQMLLGKYFRSFQFLSSFLDVEFNFEDGYQVTTFFNWCADNQWTVFLSDQTNIRVDCLSHEDIKRVQNLAKHCSIMENYKKLDLLHQAGVITEITYDQMPQPTFHFENEFSIKLLNCAWRLEKDGDYLVGCVDEDQNTTNIFSGLIGKKIKQIDIANSSMDARFQFENQYTLKTFTCARRISQWTIFLKSTPIFHANIQLLNQ